MATPGQGYAVTIIDAAPTTYDTRSQGWVFAKCASTLYLWAHAREDGSQAAGLGLLVATSRRRRCFTTTITELAQHHARELPELTVGHLKRVLKPLPDIASAPDAVSTQVFNSAPSIPKLIQQMEKEACLPSQLRLHMVVMLAKNSQIEGPIALTSILYRAWCRLLLMSGSAAHPARRLRGAGTPERRRSPRLRTNVASLS